MAENGSLIVSFIFLSYYTGSSSPTARLNVQNVSAILEDTCGLNFTRHLCYLTVSSYLTHLSTVLLWSRPPGTLPFRPRANRPNVNVLVVLLLLTAGDIEANPGPA